MAPCERPRICGITKPPYAPIAEMSPSAAAAFRCVVMSPLRWWASWSPERAANTLGIIRYVEPLPTPAATNRSRKHPRNSQKFAIGRVHSTASAPSAMTAKALIVTTAPPKRSASRPPKGRAREPIKAPRKAREIEAEPTANVENAGNWSAMSLGKTLAKPMKDPKVPM